MIRRLAAGLDYVDLHFLGKPEIIATAVLQGPGGVALIDPGPSTTIGNLRAALKQQGIAFRDVRHLLLTHIHLDHAGGVGRLAERFPSAAVWVHQRGAPHLVDPARLVASTVRVWGEAEMRELFGPTEPVASGRVRSLEDADTIALGDRDLLVLETPGHASHHVALVDSRTGSVFTGDALGIHVPDLPVLRPATPPPEFDLERYVDSIERIRRAARSVLLFAHFGPLEEVDATCDLAIRRVRDWAGVVQQGVRDGNDPDELVARLESAALADIETGAEAGLDLETLEDRLRLLSSIRMNAQGLARYWEKRRDRAARESDPREAS